MTKPIENRRYHLSRIVAVFLLPGTLAAAAPCQAAANTAAPPTLAKPGPGAAALYEEAELLVRRGRHYERAATLFEQAAAREPDNPAHPLARGCALVNRVASLSHAAYFAEQPEKASALISIVVKDDGKRYRLTREQLATRLSGLCREARRALDQGVTLGRTSEEKAEAEYIRGWGLFVIRMYATFGREAKTEGVLLIAGVPKETEIRAGFTRATELSPNKGVYWESLGCVSVEDPKLQKGYFRRALDREPRNLPLWYRLYRLETGDTTASPLTLEGRRVAQECLENAARLDITNAFPHYVLALLLLRDAEINDGIVNRNGLNLTSEERERATASMQSTENAVRVAKALSLVEAGNAMPRFEGPRYRPPLPRLLVPGWEYQGNLTDRDLSHMMQLRATARSLVVVAQLRGHQKPQDAPALRATRATLGMGARLVGNWPTRDRDITDSSVINSLVGHAIAGIGYQALLNLANDWGDMRLKEAVTAEYDAYHQRVKEHQEAIQQNTTADAGATGATAN